MSTDLYAVVGVAVRGARSLYVRRSSVMQNYPNVWSLLSIQCTPEEFEDAYDFGVMRDLMARMSQERLGGVPVRVERYLSTGNCANNPIRRHVHLHLYQIAIDAEPVLNPNFYTDAAWLTLDEYAERSKDAQCGLCTRMWADYCQRSTVPA